MKRARAAARKNPRQRTHTAKFDRAVSDIRRSLKKYHRAGSPYAIAQAALGKRALLKAHRRVNPAPGFILIATRPGSKQLHFEGGKFSESGRPIHFVTRADAQKAAAAMKRQHAILARWRLSAIPAGK